MWDPTKAMLGGKFIALSTYIRKKKKGRSKINYVSFHLGKLERKNPHIKSEANKGKEIIKIRVEIN